MRRDPRLLAQALSNVLVRLQADPLQHLISLAASQRQALDTMANLARQAAFSAWMSAGSEARNYVTLILRNNPQRPLEEVLGRVDVQQALLIPFEEAASTAKTAITQVWDGASALGQTHANQLLSALNLPGAEAALPPLPTSLLHDVDANVATARARFIQAMAADDPAARMSAIMADQARRARSSADVAATRAHYQAMEQMLQAAMADQGILIRKMWVTRFGPGTCTTCAKLHGTVRNLGQEFPPDGSPPVYGGVLHGPPRHPNCRCRIVPYMASLSGEVSPETLKQYATAWMATHG